MPNPKIEADVLPKLEEALSSKVGVELELISPEEAKAYRAHIYSVRRDKPEYASISVIDQGNKLWLIKKETADE
jgi:hypothetical protein